MLGCFMTEYEQKYKIYRRSGRPSPCGTHDAPMRYRKHQTGHKQQQFHHMQFGGQIHPPYGLNCRQWQMGHGVQKQTQ